MEIRVVVKLSQVIVLKLIKTKALNKAFESISMSSNKAKTLKIMLLKRIIFKLVVNIINMFIILKS